MKLAFSLIALLFLSTMARSETTNTILLLWPDGAPGALGKTDKDIPTLTSYDCDPDKETGAAMVVCPGGGYGGLAEHEGKDYALWLNAQGITAFVLKYRLGSAGYRHPIMLGDAARAVRLVRSMAKELRLDPNALASSALLPAATSPRRSSLISMPAIPTPPTPLIAKVPVRTLASSAIRSSPWAMKLIAALVIISSAKLPLLN